ncbi:MAG: methyltransferase domain-containing protein [Verrucomicrobia bacterium]|nr:methyltransferase domain-containing protein [Verrucomicrobiota bacterium]
MRTFFGFFKPLLESIARLETAVARRWVASAHRRLMLVQWSLPPQPEHFDHHIDLFHQWLATRSSFWVERGVFGSLALKGGDVLELACGDGFNARNFYSLQSRSVVACDFDPAAIRTARRKNAAPNLRFELADIRDAMPTGQYDNVVWDAAIEHFTPEEVTRILAAIKERLTPGGILSGYTIVAQEGGSKMLTHHEYEFKSKEDLLGFLTPHFSNVTVFETAHPARRNLYFWASEGTIPFAPDWPDWVSHSKKG